MGITGYDMRPQGSPQLVVLLYLLGVHTQHYIGGALLAIFLVDHLE